MVETVNSDVAKDMDLTPNPAFPRARLVERTGHYRRLDGYEV